MRLDLRRLSVAPMLAAVAFGVAACGSSSSSTTSSSSSSATSATSTSASVPVAGKSTSVVVNPTTAQALKQAGIAITPVAPATAHTVLLFPVSGGQVVVATLAGTIEHSGGVILSHEGKSVQLADFTIDTNTKQLTALVAGQRVPIFELNLASLKRATGPNGTVIASNIRMTLTAQAATALNSALGLSTFVPGLPFGVATVTVAVKA
jgi:hypothetical protein